ncbi:MAG: hypothetical protein O2816_15720 [Planctomycetota bacterium]|nr:hypothetical protein [Planctomycetota bacterium]
MQWIPLTLGATCLVALGSAAPTGSDGEDAQTALSHKAHNKWEFVLPGEHWRDVGDSITLPGGLEFATEAEGPLKLLVDTNADGRTDNEVKGSKIGFLTLNAKNTSGEQVKYSIRLKNVAAGKWQWATGSSMTGKVGGVLVHVFDQDGNGRYDDYGVDAIAIGSEKSASLLSKAVSIDGKLHTFHIDPSGANAKVGAFEGETGVLVADSGFETRGKLTAAVFQNGDYSFQVAGDGKGLTVPAGRYQFVSGRVERGAASASIRQGRMRAVDVAAGETTKLAWGEAVSGEFDFKQTGTQVTVQSNFAFFGAAGEEYYDFQPRGKGPKIILKDTNKGRDLREGRFPES